MTSPIAPRPPAVALDPVASRAKLLQVIEPALGGAVVALVKTMFVTVGCAIVAACVGFGVTLGVSTLRAVLVGAGCFAVVAIAGAMVAPGRALAAGLARALAKQPIGANVSTWLVERVAPNPHAEIPVGDVEAKVTKLFDLARQGDGPGVRGKLADRFRDRILDGIRGVTHERLQLAKAADGGTANITVSQLASQVGLRIDGVLHDRIVGPSRQATWVAIVVAIAASVAIVALARTV